MPITQARMIALINAAGDFEQALNAGVAMVKTHQQYVAQGTMSAGDALTYLGTLIQPLGLLSNPIGSNTILTTERRHFKSNARANISAAKRQAIKRRGEGVDTHARAMDLVLTTYDHIPVPRDSAPQSLVEGPALAPGLVEDQLRKPNETRIAKPEENQEINLAFDEADPENFLTQGGSLTEERRAELEAEVEALSVLEGTEPSGDEVQEG
jgi:hypothetical protein